MALCVLERTDHEKRGRQNQKQHGKDEKRQYADPAQQPRGLCRTDLRRRRRHARNDEFRRPRAEIL
jgi:hypothetical protein